MGRSESKAVTQQGQQQSAQDQSNAQKAFGDTTAGIGDYKTAVSNFIKANPYGAGGEYAKAQSAVGNNVAAAGQNALANDVNENALRTGENSANNAAVIAESRRAGQRNLANFLANTNQDRIGKDVSYRTTGLQAEGQIPAMTSGLYNSSVSGANGALGNAAQTARTPGFWDQMAPAIVGAAGQVGAGFAKGGCWIAEAIYGPEDIRTHLVREWLNVVFATQRFGKHVMAFYLRFGQMIAGAVKRSRVLSAILKPLFDSALSSAIAWKAQQEG